MATPWSAYPWEGLLIFLLWAASPFFAWWASQPCPSPTAILRAKDQRYLDTLARDTWRFFERCVTSLDHHLPPDNLQLVPESTLAHRTSPTNIGLYLLAACCAREFGWISTGELSRRLTLTLDSVEQLTKHQGHLLNWYDTLTLEPLNPAYVSTVDSGNLAGMLLAVAHACAARRCIPRWTSAVCLTAKGICFTLACALTTCPWTPVITTCWPQSRASPAFWQLPKATYNAATGQR